MSYISSLPTSSLQEWAIAIELVFPLVSLVFVSLRVYVRVTMKNFGWDDGLIILAMILAIGLAVSSIVAIRLDCIAVHYWDIPSNWDYRIAFLWLYVMGVMYNPIASIVKLSVLVFIIRFSGVKATVRYVVWGTGVFQFLQMISVFIVMMLDCVPFAKNWDLTLQGHCVDTAAFTMASSILCILTDAVSIGLPFYIFLQLKVSTRRKLGLMIVFSLGVLAMIFSCIRLYFIHSMESSTDPDVNYSLTTTYSAIEVNLAIWAGSVPALYPLLRGRIKKQVDESEYHGAQGYYGRQSGWVRTNDQSRSRGTCVDDKELEMKAMTGSQRTRTEITKSPIPGDSDEECLAPGTEHSGGKGSMGILKTTRVSIVRDRV